LSEALLLQAVPMQWTNLTSLATAESLMVSARIISPLREWMANADAKDHTSVASRLELLGWHLAAEQLQQRSESGGLLLHITQREFLDDRLIDALDQVSSLLTSERQIGVCVHWEWATATPETVRLFKRLRDRGVVVAFDEFSGGGGCIESMDQAPPNYLIFSSQVIRGTADQPRRLQRLEIVQATCETRRIETVMPDSITRDDELACQQVGMRVARTCEVPARKEAESLVAAFA
jgi:EAL domain-containing protein (putative c-di-GMP-specific phosphodiesterase class I)